MAPSSAAADGHDGDATRRLSVVELSRGIAGAYCGKLLNDGGAEVIMVEPVGGHRLRTQASQPGARPGMVFEYLAAGKGSITADHLAATDLIENADIIIDELAVGDPLAELLSRRRPGAVLVSVSPFGRSGPWSARPGNDAIAQAWSGGSGRRGYRDRAPLMAGNQVSDWVGGAYAAAIALASARGAEISGLGADLDLSLAEAAAVTLNTYSCVTSSFMDGRTLQIVRQPPMPGIEPTADGMIGFMPQTAQQWEDFFLMIERPDFADDDSLKNIEGRDLRAGEIADAVGAWMSTRTTAAILELATAFRLPVAPIVNGRDLAESDHLAARDALVTNSVGVRQPRRPYRIDSSRGAEPGPIPAQGSGPSAFTTPPASSVASSSGASSTGGGLPLEGVRVLDFSAFWAAPAVTQLMACLGADVIKVESIQHPDGMRQASTRPSDPRWHEWSGIFASINVNKRGITLDLTRPEGVALAERLVEWADVVIENFTPRVMPGFGLDWPRIHEINPRAVMVRMPGFGLSGPMRDMVGFARTMEQMSGLSYVTGFPDLVPYDVGGVCDPIGGLHALVGLLVALRERESSGVGTLVESALQEAAINITAEQIMQYCESGTLIERQGNRGPDAAPQGTYRCSGADDWVVIAVGDDEQWRALVTAIGDPRLAAQELSDATGRRAAHDEIDSVITAWTASRDRSEIVDVLVGSGVPAAASVTGLDIVDNPQFRARGFFESVTHPVAGTHEYPTLPFRLSTHEQPWFRTPAPLLGEHNHEVLGGVLGLDDAEIEALVAAQIIGTERA